MRSLSSSVDSTRPEHVYSTQHLSGNLSGQDNAPQVRRRLPEAGDPKVRNKLAALLQHASQGVAQNPTAGPADVLLFCHSVLSDGGPSRSRQIAISFFLHFLASCCLHHTKSHITSKVPPPNCTPSNFGPVAIQQLIPTLHQCGHFGLTE